MPKRYFACPNCHTPITWKQILDDCSSGGQGMCYCNYMLLEWSKEFNNFEPVFSREMYEYVEITKLLYNKLKEMNVENRILHAYIPKSQRIVEK